MKKFLVVVDMQNDFVEGSLGTKEALAIVDNVAETINNFQGKIFATYDTHFENYMETSEGKNQDFEIFLIGLCTDICVVSNALILKAYFPEMEISVISDCCAGVSPETHKSALDTMKCCQINIL